MSAYQKEFFDKIYEISKIPKSELYRRAFDLYLILHKDELREAGIELPAELQGKDKNSVMTPLPKIAGNSKRQRGE